MILVPSYIQLSRLIYLLAELFRKYVTPNGFDCGSATVPGQSLVEEKIRQLQAENAQLQASLDEERQENAAFKQQTCDLHLVSLQFLQRHTGYSSSSAQSCKSKSYRLCITMYP